MDLFIRFSLRGIHCYIHGISNEWNCNVVPGQSADEIDKGDIVVTIKGCLQISKNVPALPCETDAPIDHADGLHTFECFSQFFFGKRAE